MTEPAAKGERFLAVAGEFMTMQEIALVLKARMGAAAKRVPSRVLPSWLVRAVAFVARDLKQVVPELDRPKQATNEKAKRMLGWEPRSNEDAVVATAESLVRLRLLKKP
jgi:dihydroflavonol-4-reductase